MYNGTNHVKQPVSMNTMRVAILGINKPLAMGVVSGRERVVAVPACMLEAAQHCNVHTCMLQETS